MAKKPSVPCLIVDDSRIVRHICRDILKNLGFTSTEAANGLEALELCKKNKFAFILLDWHMPEMDGMEFMKNFPRNEDGPKIIICTTENEIAKIEVALRAGADEYIMKPFNGEIIRDKLQQIGLL